MERSTEIDVRGLALRFVGGLLGFVLIFGLTGYLLRDVLLELSEAFVEAAGGPGVFAGFLLPDAFSIPFPQDAFLAFGLIGGMSFLELLLWATAGSIAGGSISFLLGRWFGKTGWFRRMMDRRGAEAEALAARYGSIALAIGALTPLPYSILCMSSGAMGMTPGRFLGISSLRLVRVLISLLLIQWGVFSVIG